MKAFLFCVVVATSLVLAAAPVNGQVATTDGRTLTAGGTRTSHDARNQSPAPGASSTGSGGSQGGSGGPRAAMHWFANGFGCVTGHPSFRLGSSVVPVCSGAPSAPGPSPMEAAYQAWYWQTTLPTPTLATSPPGGAVTGLDLYLSIGGPQTLAFDIKALGYDIHLAVTVSMTSTGATRVRRRRPRSVMPSPKGTGPRVACGRTVTCATSTSSGATSR